MENYSYFIENGPIIIFQKNLGDNNITLEYDVNTKSMKKFVNDFRKKVEVNIDKDDVTFINTFMMKR